MVTQIYTPPVQLKNPKAFGSPVGVQKKMPDDAGANGSDDSQRDPSRGLAALKEQSQNGVISIHAVLSDFQNTMTALGVSQEVREEVQPYLQVIIHQAQKTQPAMGLMKQNLRGAAQTLDEFISKTLGQKSNVVKEWVDALLLQHIDYKSDRRIDLSATPEAESPMAGKNEQDSDSDPLKQGLQNARQAAQSGQLDEAVEQYQQLLKALPASDSQSAATIQYQMGRCLEKAGNPQAAKACYQKSSAALGDSSQPKLQAKVQKAMGSLLGKEGDTTGAIQHLQNALDAEQKSGNDGAQAGTLNQLAILKFRESKLDEAKPLLDQALEKAKIAKPDMLTDIYSNLGAVSRKAGRYSDAFGYYKQSLGEAQKNQDPQAQHDALQKIAALYLDTGKTDKAYKLLQQFQA